MIKSPNVQEDERPARRAARVHLALAFAAFILIGCNDGALGVLIPSMRSFYRIDAVTVSWLFLAATTGYLSSSFNTGLLMIYDGSPIWRRF